MAKDKKIMIWLWTITIIAGIIVLTSAIIAGFQFYNEHFSKYASDKVKQMYAQTSCDYRAGIYGSSTCNGNTAFMCDVTLKYTWSDCKYGCGMISNSIYETGCLSP